MVRVQQSQDVLVGVLAAMVFENFGLHAHGVILAKVRSELHSAVDEIIVFDETADEADNDDWRSRRGRRIYTPCRVTLAESDGDRKEREKNDKRGTHLLHQVHA